MKLLKLEVENNDVKKWQYFLPGQELYQGLVSGKFDVLKQDVTIEFQKARNLQADGVVGNKSFGRAIMFRFGLITDTCTDKSGESFPAKPNFPPLVSNVVRVLIFGVMAYKSKPLPNNPEHIEITNNWDRENIVKVTLPQLQPLKVSPTVYFHKKAANKLIQLFNDWETAGLLHKILSYDGTYNPRFVRGSKSVLSNHAFGTAFDINYNWNKLGVIPKLVGQKGSVWELVQIANDNGFYWGGHFDRKDGMHFEIAKLL